MGQFLGAYCRNPRQRSLLRRAAQKVRGIDRVRLDAFGVGVCVIGPGLVREQPCQGVMYPKQAIEPSPSGCRPSRSRPWTDISIEFKRLHCWIGPTLCIDIHPRRLRSPNKRRLGTRTCRGRILVVELVSSLSSGNKCRSSVAPCAAM